MVLPAAILALPAQITAMQAQLVRIQNGSARNDSDTIVMPPNAAGVLPAIWTPANMERLKRISGPRTTALLNFYGQPLAANANLRRRALTAFIGGRSS